jgi:hypothetical protein
MGKSKSSQRITGAHKLARDIEITRKARHGWTNAEIGKHYDLNSSTLSRIIQKEIRQRHAAHAGGAEAIAASLKLERFSNSLAPESQTSTLPATGGHHADAYQNTLTLNLEVPWDEAKILLRHVRTLVGILERQLICISSFCSRPIHPTMQYTASAAGCSTAGRGHPARIAAL